MMAQLMTADSRNRGLVLDPRTKLLLMLIIVIFSVGGVGSDLSAVVPASRCIGLMPVLLLLTAKQWKRASIYGGLYAALTVVSYLCLPHLKGGLQILTAVCCMGILRIMPALIMGGYMLSSTTVSEFIAALHRMNIPAQITIPLSVMFRFFPTVMEEFAAINTAMKMRDIRLGGKQAGKMLEYRIIPLLVCSVNIGNEISAAALTRALSVSRQRTNICRIGFHEQDLIIAVISVSPLLLWILGKLGVMHG